MSGKAIAIGVLVLVAGGIIYYMFTSVGDDAGKETNETDYLPDEGSNDQFDALLLSKRIECGPLSKYYNDPTTDIPGTMKPGATRIWMDGCVYPIDAAIANGIGAYKNKPKIVADKPKIV